MGAWGVQFTGNDGALDFWGELADSRDWASVEAQLREFVADDGYEGGEEAFAAAEIVAAASGKPSDHLDSEHAAWALTQSSAAATNRSLAIQVTELLATKSELNELWSEADEYSDWQASVENLKSRLG
jgi:hypothetical protein